MSNLFRGNGRVILARDYGYKPLFNNGVSLTTGFCDVDRRRVVVQYPCSLRSPLPPPSTCTCSKAAVRDGEKRVVFGGEN